MPIGKHTQIYSEILCLSSQFGGGSVSGSALPLTFFKGIWRLICTFIILVLHMLLVGHHVRTEGDGAVSGRHGTKIQEIA